MERYISYMARRRFFVDEIHSGHAHIRGEDAHHLTRVLRVETGQKYEISDNSNVYLAEIEAARKDLVSFAVLEKLAAPEARVHITAAVALIKFDRFEWLVEKATELGVDRIVPFEAGRSEKGLDRAATKRVERWRKIARESSEQSRRSRLPEVDDPVSFSDVIAMESGYRLALEEQAGARPILTVLPQKHEPGATVSLLVGPEGGWTERERSSFTEGGWMPASLGSTVLRTETAAISAIAVIAAAWSGR